MSSEAHDSHSDPLLEADHGGGHGGGDDHGEGNWLVSYADMMTLLVGFFVILLSFSQVDQEKFEEAKKSVSKEFGGKYEKPFEDIANRIREALKNAGAGDQIMIKTTDKGVEISFLGPVFFDTGSADVKPQAKKLLDELLGAIQAETGEFTYVVEGHTDDVPLSSSGVFKNNWELSSIRACRVVDYFTGHGIDKGHLTAIGYGENRPLVPNRDKDGQAIPENQSQNRRVVIKMVKKESDAL